MLTLLKWTSTLLDKILDLGEILFFVPLSDVPFVRDLISFFGDSKFASFLYNAMDAPLVAFIILDALSLICIWKVFRFFVKLF